MDFFRLRIILSMLVLFLNLTSASALRKPRLSIVDWDQYSTREEDGKGTYSFGYDIEDAETNNIQTRSEERYPNGTVVGTYGYVQPDGSVLMVNYIADVLGYRATVETNPRGVLKPVKIDTSDIFRSNGNFAKINKNKVVPGKELNSFRGGNNDKNSINYDYEEITNYEGIDQQSNYQDVAYSVYEPKEEDGTQVPHLYHTSSYNNGRISRSNSPNYPEENASPIRYFLYNGQNS